jgi:hypothetical protein
MQRIFIKKCFLFTVGSVCRVKRFTTGWKTFRCWRRSWNGGAEVAETIFKRLLRCGFRRTGKTIGQVYQCWWRMCREINVSSRFEYHMVYVLYPFVTNLLTLPRTWLEVLIYWPSLRYEFLKHSDDQHKHTECPKIRFSDVIFNKYTNNTTADRNRCYCGVGWDWVHLVSRPLLGYCTSPGR